MTKKIWTWIVAGAIVALLAGCAPRADDAAKTRAPEGETAAQKDAAEKSPAPAQPDGQEGKARPTPPPPPAETQPVRASAALKDVVGKWTMDLPGISKSMNEDLKKKGKATFGGSLEIKQGGAYEFRFGLAGQQAVTKGNATVANGVLTLKPTDDGPSQIKAQPMGTNFTFKLSQDGTRLLSSMRERGNLNFTRD